MPSRWSNLQKRYPAVDIDRLPGHEITQRRGEEQHGTDAVLRHLNSLQRSQAHGRFSEFDHLRRRVFLRKRVAGSETIDINVVAADFARQGTGEADGRRFRSDVMDSSRRPGEYGAGGDVDNLAGFLLAHSR